VTVRPDEQFEGVEVTISGEEVIHRVVSIICLSCNFHVWLILPAVSVAIRVWSSRAGRPYGKCLWNL